MILKFHDHERFNVSIAEPQTLLGQLGTARIVRVLPALDPYYLVALAERLECRAQHLNAEEDEV